VTFFATANGLQIVSGSLLIPLVGAWTADLQLATDQAIAGQVSVVIGNLTLQGFAYRSQAYGGQTRARLVGGYGGWRTTIPPQGYGSQNGVKLSTVLQDAASGCGEEVSIFADVTIGTAYARTGFEANVASDVLWQMIALGHMSAWYVAPSGVTMTGPWPEATVGTPFIPSNQKPDEGIIEIATEDYASWMPGASFSHPLLATTYTSAGVEYVWGDDGEFRFNVLTGTTADRVLGPLQQAIDARTTPLRFFGRYSYTISNPSSTTIDGAPTDTTLGLPDLQNVPIRSDSLASYTPPSGGACDIMFLDGDPTKPVCVWTEASAQNSPTDITIAPAGKGQSGAARVNDTVQVIFPPLIQAAGTVGGLPFVGVLQITSPATGTIQTGSQTVSIPN
jgi:hypothetical protein